MRVIVEQLMEWRLAGETEVLGENLPQRHFVHHKSHMTRPVLLLLHDGTFLRQSTKFNLNFMCIMNYIRAIRAGYELAPQRLMKSPLYQILSKCIK
jgi:hypothetical protein